MMGNPDETYCLHLVQSDNGSATIDSLGCPKDFTLVAGDMYFHCHKALFGAASNYLLEMLMKSSSDNVFYILEDDTLPIDVEKLLLFVYTGEVKEYSCGLGRLAKQLKMNVLESKLEELKITAANPDMRHPSSSMEVAVVKCPSSFNGAWSESDDDNLMNTTPLSPHRLQSLNAPILLSPSNAGMETSMPRQKKKEECGSGNVNNKAAKKPRIATPMPLPRTLTEANRNSNQKLPPGLMPRTSNSTPEYENKSCGRVATETTSKSEVTTHPVVNGAPLTRKKMPWFNPAMYSTKNTSSSSQHQSFMNEGSRMYPSVAGNPLQSTTMMTLTSEPKPSSSTDLSVEQTETDKGPTVTKTAFTGKADSRQTSCSEALRAIKNKLSKKYRKKKGMPRATPVLNNPPLDTTPGTSTDEQHELTRRRNDREVKRQLSQKNLKGADKEDTPNNSDLVYSASQHTLPLKKRIMPRQMAFKIDVDDDNSSTSLIPNSALIF